MNIQKAFGHVLRSTREGMNISQESLALSAGVDRTFVSLLERGLRQPSLSTIIKLSSALNVEPGSLVDQASNLINKDLANEDS